MGKSYACVGECTGSSHIKRGRGNVSQVEGQGHQLLGDVELRKDEAGRLETEIQPVIRAQVLLYSKSQMRSQHRVQPINHSIPCVENLCQHKSVPQPGLENDGLTLLQSSRSA